jgi:3-oxoacyl-[acyl-carrier protein] reductase
MKIEEIEKGKNLEEVGQELLDSQKTELEDKGQKLLEEQFAKKEEEMQAKIEEFERTMEEVEKSKLPSVFTWSGKNVLITGGSRGIGAITVNILSKAGLKVWINYNNSEAQANQIKSAIVAGGGKAETIKFDVSKPSEVSKAFKRIIKEDGQIDYVVNNAGIVKDSSLLAMKTKDLKDVIETNLYGTIYVTQEAVKAMGENKFGAIVNMSSVSGDRGNPGQSAYAASKGAIVSFSKTVAQEAAPKGIRINVVSPGLTKTEMAQRIPPAMIARMMQVVPLRRMAEIQEVASTIAFMLSDQNSYMCGEVVKVNGGLYT